MQVNVENFQNIIRKATLNYTIPSVQLKVDGSKVISNMRSNDNTVVVCLNTPNDSITSLVDEVELNFDEPNTKVKPYLNLIDSETANIGIADDKMTLIDGRHRTNLFFCMSSFVTVFTGAQPNISPFYELQLTEEIRDVFEKIKKVAGKFEKVYFSVKNNKFIVETTDRTNRFSNGISFEIDNVNHDDLDICFDFKNFQALLACIEADFTSFSAKFTWVKAQGAGMVLFGNNDGSEKYYLLSKLEEE